MFSEAVQVDQTCVRVLTASAMCLMVFFVGSGDLQ
jgi:hypothetical protein